MAAISNAMIPPVDAPIRSTGGRSASIAVMTSSAIWRKVVPIGYWRRPIR